MQHVIDFATGTPTWRSIDDVVMGGISSSRMAVEEGVGVFSGVLSLENNGGFASVRTIPAAHDLGGFDGLVVRVRGDGKRYKLRLRTTDAFDGVSYQAELAPPADRWVEVELPFDDFVAVFRGRRVAGAGSLDPEQIRTFGLLISDKQTGPFRLEIEWIAAVRRGEGGGDDS